MRYLTIFFMVVLFTTSVWAQNSTTVLTITYSEPMKVDTVIVPEYYSISGEGAGTLQPNPVEVIEKNTDGTIYDLKWVGGKMLDDGDLILNIDGINITDLAGNHLDETSWEIELPEQGVADRPRVVTVVVSIILDVNVDVDVTQ